MSHIRANFDINFLPVIKGSTIAGTGTYTTQVGVSHALGNLIFITINLVWTAHTGTGNMLIDNLLATVANITNYNPEVVITLENISWPPAAGYIVGEFQNNTKNISLFSYKSNQARTPVAMNSSGSLHASGFYLTNQVV